MNLQNQILREYDCPALGRVILYKQTWYQHIISRPEGSRKMEGKLDLLGEAIEAIKDNKAFFRFTTEPMDSWFADHECPDFLQQHDCLRIAFKRQRNGTIIVASAYPKYRGVVHYEP